MSTIILGIESSCDDTSAAVIKDGYLLSNVVSSQAVHEAYGGVVPELASRAHQQNIVPVVHEALKRAGVTKEELNAVGEELGGVIETERAIDASNVALIDPTSKKATRVRYEVKDGVKTRVAVKSGKEI